MQQRRVFYFFAIRKIYRVGFPRVYGSKSVSSLGSTPTSMGVRPRCLALPPNAARPNVKSAHYFRFCCTTVDNYPGNVRSLLVTADDENTTACIGPKSRYQELGFRV